jgi:hypothetical protein
MGRRVELTPDFDVDVRNGFACLYVEDEDVHGQIDTDLVFLPSVHGGRTLRYVMGAFRDLRC